MRLGRNEDYDVAAVRAARRGVGADGDVMVDGSHRYSLDTAQRIARVLAEERVFPKGTKFEATAVFDNSPGNRFNPDPKASVRFGDQTWDEMMVGFIDIAVKPDQDLTKLIKLPPGLATGGQ